MNDQLPEPLASASFEELEDFANGGDALLSRLNEAAAPNRSRPTKKGKRRSRAEMRAIRDAIYETVAAETLTYNLIDQYAERTKVAFVLIHHAAKGDQSGKAVTDVGAGAGAQSRATDCHMILRPHEEDGCAVLDAAVRSFPPIDPVTLRWAYPVWIDDQHLDPAKLKGRDGKAAQKRADDDRTGMAAIVESLGGEELTNRQLRKLTGMSRERVGRLLDMLESQGKVVSKTIEKQSVRNLLSGRGRGR